jgi:serine/threonine protein kinase
MRILSQRPTVAADAGSAGLTALMTRLEQLVPDQDAAAGERFAFLDPAGSEDELGRFAGYRILELLGRGGMGYVFRAEDPRLHRSVALKVMRPELAQNPSACQRFLREARAMAAVRHDHIAVIHEVGAAATPAGDDLPYLTMELLEGTSLDRWLRAHPRLPIADVLRIGREAAAGLAAAHATGLVHRDVKPSNLWLEAPPGWRYDPPADRPPLGAVGRVKLIDFGMAGPANPDAQTGVSGTLGYMPPEQLVGSPQDARCDLFALGVVLYELTTGEHPYPGRGLPGSFTGDPAPASVRDLRPDAPAELARLIRQMMEEAPADRPPSARIVERELAAIRPNGAEPAHPVRRNRWWPPVAAACVLGVGALGAYLREPTLSPTGPVPSPSSAVATADPPTPPLDPWCDRLAELSSHDQFAAVRLKIRECNPGCSVWDTKSKGWVEKEGVLRFSVISDRVHDIGPIACLRDVKQVSIRGTPARISVFSDPSPLARLRLHTLTFEYHPHLTSVAGIRGIELVELNLFYTGVTSVAGLNTRLLETLRLCNSPVRDLSPVAAMPRLKVLDCKGCPVESYRPLERSTVRELWADFDPVRDHPVLRANTRLTHINGKPVAEYWRSVGPPARNKSTD